MRAGGKSCNYHVDNSIILSAGYKREQNHINKNVGRIFIIIFHSGKSSVSISYSLCDVCFIRLFCDLPPNLQPSQLGKAQPV